MNLKVFLVVVALLYVAIGTNVVKGEVDPCVENPNAEGCSGGGDDNECDNNGECVTLHPCDVDPDSPACTNVTLDPCDVDPGSPACTNVTLDPCAVDPDSLACTEPQAGSPWTSWSESPCVDPVTEEPVTCGGGRQKRTRILNPVNGACIPAIQFRLCNINQCPVDCILSEWSIWSGCSVTCGPGGCRRRYREIITPPLHGGKECSPLVDEKGSCPGPSYQCPVDCEMERWSVWSACSAECGPGIKTRTRNVQTEPNSSGNSCPQSWEQQLCSGNNCKSINCEVSEWTAWSAGEDSTFTDYSLYYRPRYYGNRRRSYIHHSKDSGYRAANHAQYKAPSVNPYGNSGAIPVKTLFKPITKYSAVFATGSAAPTYHGPRRSKRSPVPGSVLSSGSAGAPVNYAPAQFPYAPAKRANYPKSYAVPFIKNAPYEAQQVYYQGHYKQPYYRKEKHHDGDDDNGILVCRRRFVEQFPAYNGESCPALFDAKLSSDL